MVDDIKYSDRPDFNFGATSEAELKVFGSARPGAKQQRCYSPDLRVPASEVAEWVDFVKAAGVQHVISLLSASELETYAEPLPQGLQAAFGSGNYANIDPKTPDGPKQIMQTLRSARADGQTVLVHCWGGGGRTGIVQAAWLVEDKGLSPEDAAQAVTEYANSQGLSRRADTQALREFLSKAEQQV
eukprot:GHRR01001111.1.p2 GENE.GHRR01001111.1~~GHRR01001111.1.p2  ORF type:complete len:186 (+),score=60.18 GHRR01001111.1:1238-1795(+)